MQNMREGEELEMSPGLRLRGGTGEGEIWRLTTMVSSWNIGTCGVWAPVRYPRGAYLERHVWQVPGDAVGVSEVTWENGSHRGARAGTGRKFTGTPTAHLCKTSPLTP